MVILILLAIFIVCCRAVEVLRRSRSTRSGDASSRQVSQPLLDDAAASPSVPSGLTWSALDDVQLTRLLTEAARQTNTD